MNCFIYIPKDALDYAKDYLTMRNVKFAVAACEDGTIEIASKEKFSKVLDNLAKRCYNKDRK